MAAITPDNITFVMRHTGCNRDDAISYLAAEEGCPFEAIRSLRADRRDALRTTAGPVAYWLAAAREQHRWAVEARRAAKQSSPKNAAQLWTCLFAHRERRAIFLKEARKARAAVAHAKATR